jgi:hypothetical protein
MATIIAADAIAAHQRVEPRSDANVLWIDVITVPSCTRGRLHPSQAENARERAALSGIFAYALNTTPARIQVSKN